MMKFLGLFVAIMIVGISTSRVHADDVVVNPGGLIGPNPSTGGSGIGDVNNGIVWISPSTGYLVYITTSSTVSAELNWIKTVDAGVSWSTPITIQADTGQTQPVAGFGIWYDRWTDDRFGTDIHIAWTSNETGFSNTRLKYTSLDTSNDVLSGEVITTTMSDSSGQVSVGGVSLTITDSGKIYIYASVGSSLSTQKRLMASDDGITWLSRNQGASGFIPGRIAPALENNVFLVSADDIFVLSTSGQILQYQFGANTWIQIQGSMSGFDVAQTVAINPTVSRGLSGTPYVFYGFLNAPDSTTHEDFLVIRQNVSSATTFVTPVFENTGIDYHSASLMYDDANDRLYAFYINTNTDQVFYKFSDDAGITWSEENRFDTSLNAKGNMALPNTVNNGGGRLMPIWTETTTLVTELDAAISLIAEPEIEGGDQSFEPRLERFVDGIGFSGDSGKFWFAALTGMFLGIIMILFRAPMMVLFAIEGMYATMMALVGFLPFEFYFPMVALFGVLLILLILRSVSSGAGSEDY